MYVIRNPGRFCSWNRNPELWNFFSRFFNCFFLVGWGGGGEGCLGPRQTSYLNITLCQRVQVILHNLYRVHKSKSAVQWLHGLRNQYGTCSGLPNKRYGVLHDILTDYIVLVADWSSRKVREIFVFWVLYAFSTLGDDRQLVEWPAHFYFIKPTSKFFMFQASFYHTLPKILSAMILALLASVGMSVRFCF